MEEHGGKVRFGVVGTNLLLPLWKRWQKAR